MVFWTFLEINEGDYVSFLYGAKVFNHYIVDKKKCFKNAEKLPPWPPLTFKISGKTYYFPFRLYLKPIRNFVEPIVRTEFTYVAENLLLRGGYRKTHFQADQTTLQSVSQMGIVYNGSIESLSVHNCETFKPMITWDRVKVSPPEIFYFNEFILQSIIRLWLSKNKNLQYFFNSSGLKNLQANDFEVLGEKALPEGNVDILIKDRIPTGYSRKIIIEVKLDRAQAKDVKQLKYYMDELGEECIGGILIAKNFSKVAKRDADDNKIKCFEYFFEKYDYKKNIL